MMYCKDVLSRWRDGVARSVHRISLSLFPKFLENIVSPSLQNSLLELMISTAVAASTAFMLASIYPVLSLLVLAAALWVGLHGKRSDANPRLAHVFSAIIFAVSAAHLCLVERGDQSLAVFMLMASAAIYVSAMTMEAAAESNRQELSALLAFEGKISSGGYHDQRVEFCGRLLSYCQRYSRPYSVAVIRWQAHAPPSGTGPESKFDPRLSKHITRFRLADSISAATRGSDVVICDPDRQCILIACPETDVAGCNVMLARIGRAVSSELGLTIEGKVGHYPADGFTFQELATAALCKFGSTDREVAKSPPIRLPATGPADQVPSNPGRALPQIFIGESCPGE